jgi:hypothetical protein
MDFGKSGVALGFESHFSWLKCIGLFVAQSPFQDVIMCRFSALSDCLTLWIQIQCAAISECLNMWVQV